MDTNSGIHVATGAGRSLWSNHMAAFMTFRNNTQEQFYIGDVRVRHTRDIPSIVQVQCDGHELELACLILGRSVLINRRVVTFYGDNAREIVANWT